MDIGCCHVALALVIIILPLVAMLTNRTLKAEARVTKLEKKNGKEQKQINELKLEVAELKRDRGGKKDFEPNEIDEENITFCPEPSFPEDDRDIEEPEPEEVDHE